MAYNMYNKYRLEMKFDLTKLSENDVALLCIVANNNKSTSFINAKNLDKVSKRQLQDGYKRSLEMNFLTSDAYSRLEEILKDNGIKV
jgi:hypothetical protein